MDAMPDAVAAMVLLAAWCALRFGELAELRRRDVDLKNGVLHDPTRRSSGSTASPSSAPQDRRRYPRRGDPAAPDPG